MKIETYKSLRALRETFGPRTFGRLCQKLLGLTFVELGYEHVVEREVQGVDLDAARRGGPRYAIEVKTTNATSVILAAKDFECLKARVADGYELVVAVLRCYPLGGWIMADANRLKPKSYLIDRLSAYSIVNLETEITPAFDATIAEHFTPLMQDGRKYLHKQMRSLLPGSAR